LGHEAAVRIESGKRSPFVVAVSYRPLEIVRSLLGGGAEIAECESPETPSQYYMSLLRMRALEAATQREFKILEALLPHAEHRWLPVEYYRAAYLSAKVLFQKAHMRKVSNQRSQNSFSWAPNDLPLRQNADFENSMTQNLGGRPNFYP